MSVFKTKWIILKISRIKDTDFLYTIFSYDYGIIKANKKLSKTNTWRGSRWKALDIWYVINFEISTKEEQSIHHIRNIHIISEFHHENKAFSEINNYLIFLNTILKKIPAWVPNYEVFEIVEKINTEEEIEDTKLILATLKIIQITGELPLENSDVTVKKILNFIHSQKINTILKLTWINEWTKTKLLEIIS